MNDLEPTILNRQVCTCTGFCKGAEGLGEGWVCALLTSPDALANFIRQAAGAGASETIASLTVPAVRLVDDGKAIECLRCGMISSHPEDVRYRYCGKCHRFS